MTFEQRLQAIEELIGRVRSAADPSARRSAEDLLRAVMELHGTALERLLTMAHESDGGLVERLARDPLVSSLLLLHGLHPLDIEARVRERLAGFRGVEMMSLRDGMLRLRARGADRAAVESAVWAAAPDLAGIEIEMEGFVPVEALAGGKQ